MSAPDEEPAARRLDPEKINRLAFIRLLYLQGVDQSKLPEPLMYTSLLTFHDAVELFLVLAADHLGLPAQRRDPNFMDYWRILAPSDTFPDGVPLSGQLGMDRLNRHRNALKHAGAMPGRDAVQDALRSVMSFFEDNTPRVFGAQFGGIDLADVVPQERTRASMKAAAAAEAAGNRSEAMALLADAFDHLLNQQKFGWPIVGGLSREEIAQVDDELGKHLCRVSRAVASMQTAMRVLALDIDYGRYSQFATLTREALPHRRKPAGPEGSDLSAYSRGLRL